MPFLSRRKIIRGKGEKGKKRNSYEGNESKSRVLWRLKVRGYRLEDGGWIKDGDGGGREARINRTSSKTTERYNTIVFVHFITVNRHQMQLVGSLVLYSKSKLPASNSSASHKLHKAARQG